jgi:hypothetical protein
VVFICDVMIKILDTKYFVENSTKYL